MEHRGNAEALEQEPSSRRLPMWNRQRGSIWDDTAAPSADWFGPARAAQVSGQASQGLRRPTGLAHAVRLHQPWESARLTTKAVFIDALSAALRDTPMRDTEGRPAFRPHCVPGDASAEHGYDHNAFKESGLSTAASRHGGLGTVEIHSRAGRCP